MLRASGLLGFQTQSKSTIRGLIEHFLIKSWPSHLPCHHIRGAHPELVESLRHLASRGVLVAVATAVHTVLERVCCPGTLDVLTILLIRLLLMWNKVLATPLHYDIVII